MELYELLLEENYNKSNSNFILAVKENLEIFEEKLLKILKENNFVVESVKKIEDSLDCQHFSEQFS